MITDYQVGQCCGSSQGKIICFEDPQVGVRRTWNSVLMSHLVTGGSCVQRNFFKPQSLYPKSGRDRASLIQLPQRQIDVIKVLVKVGDT